MDSLKAGLNEAASKILAYNTEIEARFKRAIVLIALASLLIPPFFLAGVMLIMLAYGDKKVKEMLSQERSARDGQLACIKDCRLLVGPHQIGCFPDRDIFRLTFKDGMHELEYTDAAEAETLAKALRVASEAHLINLSSVAFLECFEGKFEATLERGKEVLVGEVIYELKAIDSSELSGLMDRYPSSERLEAALRDGCRREAQQLINRNQSVSKGTLFGLNGTPYKGIVREDPQRFMSRFWAAQSRKG